MPTKTDRILSYLPGTFRALPRPTALYALADTFGNELQQAENSLAALMMAHWVDHADKGAEFICDLAGIAALCGLAPRGAPAATPPVAGQTMVPVPVPADETVEEFREHLKHYVRTFLQGTATVQGILRVTAEALGLHIADNYADLDTWWTRPDDTLVTTERRGEDATALLFGAESVTATGQPARPAQVIGPELGATVELTDASVLRLKVDGGAAVQVDLPAQAGLDEIVKAINDKVKPEVARRAGSHLVLSSPKAGPGSRLEVQEGKGDAAPRLLGLLPHAYHGVAATAALVTGAVELSSPVDMSGNRPRYLRVRLDGSLLAEIDCAIHAADPANVTLDQIAQAINEALGAAPDAPIASQDQGYFILTPPKTGFASSIELQPPAAQDATEMLFGPVSRFYVGRDATPAVAIGVRDLSQGVDLSTHSRVRVRMDDRPAVMVDCAGPDPAHTRLIEIATALNSVLGSGVASQDGRFLRLASLKTGANALLSFESLPEEEDATEAIFGIGPRVFKGGAARPATIVGTTDLSGGANLWACHVVGVAVDGGARVEVDVRAEAADPAKASLDEMAVAFNAVLGIDVASHDGKHLILLSPTVGGTSSLAIEPLEETRRQRFIDASVHHG